MKKNICLIRFLGLCILISASLALAQVPSQLNYQGRISVDGTNFNGTAQFQFALVDGGTNHSLQATATATVSGGFMTIVSVDNGGSGYVSVPAVTFSGGGGTGASAHAQLGGDTVTNIIVDTPGSGYITAPTVIIEAPPPNISYEVYWTNGAPIDVYVTKGLYSVTLGDTTLTDMAALPSEIFTNSDVRLRVTFDDSVHGAEELSPHTRIVAAGYSLMAGDIQDGTITSAKLADGAVVEDSLADGAVTALKIANTAVDTAQLVASAVTSDKIEDGSIAAVDVDAASFSNTFWKINGNAGTVPAIHFIGTSDNRALEFRANDSRVLRIDPTTASPRWAAGHPGNTASAPGAAVLSGGNTASGPNKSLATYSVICGGVTNTIENGADYSIIGGGMNNIIRPTSQYNTLGGGKDNLIYSNTEYSVICGGSGNEIEPGVDHSFIGGGEDNIIHTNSYDDTIGGGSRNEMNGTGNTIGGGRLNKFTGWTSYACIAGGVGNKIEKEAYGFIGAGFYNTIESNAWAGIIPGGYQNTIGIDADYAFAAGRRANALHPGSFVWADSQDSDFSSTTTNEVAFRCAGGVRFDSGTAAANQEVSWVPGDASWTFTSDRNKKENFKPVDCSEVLNKVADLPIQWWVYKGYDVQHVGPMAQDFHAAFDVGRNKKGLDGADLDGIAFAAIQGLVIENRELKNKLGEAENINQKQNLRLIELEQKMNQLMQQLIP